MMVNQQPQLLPFRVPPRFMPWRHVEAQFFPKPQIVLGLDRFSGTTKGWAGDHVSKNEGTFTHLGLQAPGWGVFGV